MIALIGLIYNVLITLLWPFIQFVYPYFDKKFKQSMPVRKEGLLRLATFRSQIGEHRSVIWFHAASMGEFEQARPVITALRRQGTSHAVVVTFMSPSGYEARKNYPDADLVIYLPLDFWFPVGRFYSLIAPAVGVISRYEFWPNLLIRSKSFQVPLILFNASLKENHNYGKWAFRWFFKPLFRQYADILTVSDLHTSRFSNLLGDSVRIKTIGDSRFDQVIARSKEMDPDIEQFRNLEVKTIVFGSVWESDLKIWIPVLQNFLSQTKKIRVILVPHEIHAGDGEKIRTAFPDQLVSVWSSGVNAGFSVLWADVMGKLMKMYSLADAAYVGGGFGVHVHNILEPAAYGIPVSHGPVYQKAPEAVEMADSDISTVIRTVADAASWLETTVFNENRRASMGKKTLSYIQRYRGSTEKILQTIQFHQP